jgi:hypothetical protein
VATHAHACVVCHAMPCQQLCMQTYNSTSKWPEPGARRRSVLQSPPLAISTQWRGRKGGGYALRRYDGHILCRPVFSSASLNKRPYPWPWLCCMRAHLVSLSLSRLLSLCHSLWLYHLISSLSLSLSTHGKSTRTTTPAHHRPTELGRCRYSCLPRV